MASDSLNIPILSRSNMYLTFPKFFGDSLTYVLKLCMNQIECHS